jgi:hypothetical protein
MSCITAKVTRASEPCDVQVSKTEGIGVVVMAVISAVTAAVTFVSSLIVKAASVPGVNTEVALEERVNVEVGIICTVKLSDELEMWWCEGWKALWNNSKKILWRTE